MRAELGRDVALDALASPSVSLGSGLQLGRDLAEKLEGLPARLSMRLDLSALAALVPSAMPGSDAMEPAPLSDGGSPASKLAGHQQACASSEREPARVMSETQRTETENGNGAAALEALKEAPNGGGEEETPVPPDSAAPPADLDLVRRYVALKTEDGLAGRGNVVRTERGLTRSLLATFARDPAAREEAEKRVAAHQHALDAPRREQERLDREMAERREQGRLDRERLALERERERADPELQHQRREHVAAVSARLGRSRSRAVTS